MRLVLPAFAVVLIVAISLVAFGSFRSSEATFCGYLLELLPDGVVAGAWQRTLQPIADTPEMKKAVGELLSYDDGVFAVYTNGARRVSVYLAYWTPGKMSHRLIAVHTPDVCWVGGGWKRVASGTWPEAKPKDETGDLKHENVDSTRVSGLTSQRSPARSQVSGLRSPSIRVQPGELRTFVMNGQTEHVVFWHLVGGKSKSYGTGYAPPWYSPLLDLWEKGLNQREEQFFIRISSNESIEAIWDTPVVQHVIARIPGLAVAKPTVDSGQ